MSITDEKTWDWNEVAAFMEKLEPSQKKAAVHKVVGTLSGQDQQDLVPELVQKMGGPQGKAAVAKAAGTLPGQDQEDLVPELVQKMGGPQGKAAVAKAAGTLPGQDQQDLVPELVQEMGGPQGKAAVAKAVGTLPRSDQEGLAEGIFGGLDNETRKRLWYLVLGTLATAIFVFGSMAFVLMLQGKSAEAPLTLATTALGAIVGLIAINPAIRRAG